MRWMILYGFAIMISAVSAFVVELQISRETDTMRRLYQGQSHSLGLKLDRLNSQVDDLATDVRRNQVSAAARVMKCEKDQWDPDVLICHEQ